METCIGNGGRFLWSIGRVLRHGHHRKTAVHHATNGGQGNHSHHQNGLYHLTLLEWNGFDEANQTWPELKAHYTEAYDLLQRSGAGIAGEHGYHHGNSVLDIDDDSLDSIKTSITNIHQAHNANTVAINDNISAITAEASQQRTTIEALQQQLALLTVNHPTTQAPTPYYAALPAPPTAQPYAVP